MWQDIDSLATPTYDSAKRLSASRYDMFAPHIPKRWSFSNQHLYQGGKIKPGDTASQTTMYDQGGLAHNSVAFAFEHQIGTTE